MIIQWFYIIQIKPLFLMFTSEHLFFRCFFKHAAVLGIASGFGRINRNQVKQLLHLSGVVSQYIIVS